MNGVYNFMYLYIYKINDLSLYFTLLSLYFTLVSLGYQYTLSLYFTLLPLGSKVKEVIIYILKQYFGGSKK